MRQRLKPKKQSSQRQPLTALPAKKLQQSANHSENTGDRKPRPPSCGKAVFLLQVIPNGSNQKKNGNIRQNRFCSHILSVNPVQGL
jgi:hypothetical protein